MERLILTVSDVTSRVDFESDSSFTRKITPAANEPRIISSNTMINALNKIVVIRSSCAEVGTQYNGLADLCIAPYEYYARKMVI